MIAHALLAAVTAASVSGCYFARSPIRPVPALYFQHDAAARARCLVVFLPGLMDGPETIRDRELPRALARTGSPCDAVAVDATYRYYFGAHVDEVVYDDVLVPAAARGYDEIWLVGISLGGLGAVLTARAHPRIVDGVVLLSPFLGLDGVLDEIEGAGGLAEWRPPHPLPPLEDATFTVLAWAWLRGLDTDPGSMPEIYVGWAEGERVERGAQLLAAALPDGHTLHVEGRHGWDAWTPLFTELATRAAIGRTR